MFLLSDSGVEDCPYSSVQTEIALSDFSQDGTLSTVKLSERTVIQGEVYLVYLLEAVGVDSSGEGRGGEWWMDKGQSNGPNLQAACTCLSYVLACDLCTGYLYAAYFFYWLKNLLGMPRM